jgi:hypothetical protein
MKHKRINPWYKSAEFEVLEDFTIKTDIVGFEYNDCNVKLDIWGNLTVKKGFCFGASGPTFDTESSIEGSCFHDALYYISQMGGFNFAPDNDKVRWFADKLIRDLCIKNGMWHWRAWLWYENLRAFGGISWDDRIEF